MLVQSGYRAFKLFGISQPKHQRVSHAGTDFLEGLQVAELEEFRVVAHELGGVGEGAEGRRFGAGFFEACLGFLTLLEGGHEAALEIGGQHDIADVDTVHFEAERLSAAGDEFEQLRPVSGFLLQEGLCGLRRHDLAQGELDLIVKHGSGVLRGAVHREGVGDAKSRHSGDLQHDLIGGEEFLALHEEYLLAVVDALHLMTSAPEAVLSCLKSAEVAAMLEKQCGFVVLDHKAESSGRTKGGDEGVHDGWLVEMSLPDGWRPADGS